MIIDGSFMTYWQLYNIIAVVQHNRVWHCVWTSQSEYIFIDSGLQRYDYVNWDNDKCIKYWIWRKQAFTLAKANEPQSYADKEFFFGLINIICVLIIVNYHLDVERHWQWIFPLCSWWTRLMLSIQIIQECVMCGEMIALMNVTAFVNSDSWKYILL